LNQRAFTRLIDNLYIRANTFRPFLHKFHPKMIWFYLIWIKTTPLSSIIRSTWDGFTLNKILVSDGVA
jgi:hypothetical protein